MSKPNFPPVFTTNDAGELRQAADHELTWYNRLKPSDHPLGVKYPAVNATLRDLRVPRGYDKWRIALNRLDGPTDEDCGKPK